MSESRTEGSEHEDGATSVDLRGRLPLVRDQGERQTCLAFAVTAAHEFAREEGKDVYAHLSEEALYWGCKQIDGDWEPGSTFPSAAGALARWGQPLSETWPYEQYRDEADPSEPPEGVTPGDKDWFVGRLSSMQLLLDELQKAMREGSLVIIGVLLTSGFFDPHDGKIAPPKDGEPLLGGHAVLVVGFLEDEGGHLIIRNSWGTEWGDDGYALLPYGYFFHHGKEAWVIEPMTDSQGPKS